MPFLLKHHSEPDVIDLLAEIDQLDKIIEFINELNCTRICEYISLCCLYAADTDEFNKTLDVCYHAYLKVRMYPQALRMALRLNQLEFVSHLLAVCDDPAVSKQMAFMVARQRINLDQFVEQSEGLIKILSNEFMNENFLSLARDLEVTEAKTPEQVFMSHLEEQRQQLDSAKVNLASTYVNAFVNAAFGNDTLMTVEGNSWLYKNKDSGLLAAAASVGLILL